jgi:hypothetical protein
VHWINSKAKGKKMNATATVEVMQHAKPSTVSAPGEAPKSKPGPKPKKTEATVRYFLAKDGSTVDKPELGEEVVSESEVLIRAFRAKDSLYFTVTAYRAEADTKEGSPTLVKRPAQK